MNYNLCLIFSSFIDDNHFMIMIKMHLKRLFLNILKNVKHNLISILGHNLIPINDYVKMLARSTSERFEELDSKLINIESTFNIINSPRILCQEKFKPKIKTKNGIKEVKSNFESFKQSVEDKLLEITNSTNSNVTIFSIAAYDAFLDSNG